MTDFETWLYRVADSTSQRSIAAAIGVQNTALSRWIREEHVPAERVIEIARHYKVSIWDGLNAAGYLTHEDLSAGIPLAVTDTSSRVLLEELLKRALETEQLASVPDERIVKIVEQVVQSKLPLGEV